MVHSVILSITNKNWRDIWQTFDENLTKCWQHSAYTKVVICRDYHHLHIKTTTFWQITNFWWYFDNFLITFWQFNDIFQNFDDILPTFKNSSFAQFSVFAQNVTSCQNFLKHCQKDVKIWSKCCQFTTSRTSKYLKAQNIKCLWKLETYWVIHMFAMVI